MGGTPPWTTTRWTDALLAFADAGEPQTPTDQTSDPGCDRMSLMQQTAALRGGRCLSPAYINCKTHLLWECHNLHQWPATPNNVLRGSWCPQCSCNIGEELVRATLEEAFPGRKFLRTRSLPWINGSNSTDMKLAGYQGIQHYKTVGHFHRSSALSEQQVRDQKAPPWGGPQTCSAQVE